MSALYLETSALLAWLFGEPAEERVRKAVKEAELVATSTLTFAEAGRALVRAEGRGILRGGDGMRLRGLLRRAGAGWYQVAPGPRILERAARPFPVEPVRTLDALHLASALALAEGVPDLRVLSFDRRVSENACALGLA